MKNNYLFLFTLGPVQTFIAQARKTRDLYAGSQLLSDLCRVGIDEIKRHQGKIIFPHEGNKFLPNRFLAKIAEQPTSFKEIGEDVESKVRTVFKEKAEYILQQYASSRKPLGFDEQIENHLDIHWIFHPIEESYGDAYREIERLLGAIKNIRAFKQLNGGNGECGRKCSLDGERNALFYPCDSQLQEGVIKLKKLNSNEALSAVSFVKRFYYSTKERFASTTTVALMDYLEKLDDTAKSNQELRKLLDKELLERFNKKSLKELETGIFYKENLTSKYFEEHDLGDYDKDNNIQKVRKSVAELDKFAKKTSYYAVLVFDGDEMGKWLSGEFIKDQNQLQEFHETLSERLGQFAKTAAKQLVYPCGQTVYAGGDDFLGFVNLNYLFEVMMSLRQGFDCLVNQSLKQFCRNNKELTFSAGVLIAHYKMPLHIVLQEARRLEKVAKEEGGRDAFAMGVMKRSGESHQICYKWRDGEEWNVENIRFIIEQLQENFSDTFIRSLNVELPLLINEQGWIENEEMVKVEMKRLIVRSGQEESMKVNIDKLYDGLSKLFETDNKTVNFLGALNIINFLRKQVG